MTIRQQSPDFLPVLSRGKHRRSRSGACLMEFVSALAGERHTDHPKCVCPVLASMARVVNDRVADGARQRLAIVAPDFIGAAGAGLELQMSAVRRVLLTALGGARERQARFRVMVALLALDSAAQRLNVDTVVLTDAERAQLARSEPGVLHSAQDFVSAWEVAPQEYVRHGLPMALVTGVQVVGDTAATSRDDALIDLLVDTLGYYRRALEPEQAAHQESGSAISAAA